MFHVCAAAVAFGASFGMQFFLDSKTFFGIQKLSWGYKKHFLEIQKNFFLGIQKKNFFGDTKNFWGDIKNFFG